MSGFSDFVQKKAVEMGAQACPMGMSGCTGHCGKCGCRFAGSLCHGMPCSCGGGSVAGNMVHNAMQEVFKTAGLPALPPKHEPIVDTVVIKYAAEGDVFVGGFDGGNAKVVVTMSTGETVDLFNFYSDELTMTPGDFVGKTLKEARKVRNTKDIEFLRSEDVLSTWRR